ncbi:hypothetical protein D3C84_892790 [compost metagenome]
MAFGIAVLDKAQRPRTAVAVGRQRRQAQHLEMFGGNIGPGQWGGLRCCLLGSRLGGVLGGGFGHHGNPHVRSGLVALTMPAPLYRQDCPGLEA